MLRSPFATDVDDTMTDEELLRAAEHASRRAHCPYSGYRVGAAVLDTDGNVHLGCNVENASYPEGQCAEANAIGAMVTAGGTRIASIAVVGAVDDDDAGNRFADVGICTPCGGCRQRIREFAEPASRVVMQDEDGNVDARSIEDLLPASFGS